MNQELRIINKFCLIVCGICTLLILHALFFIPVAEAARLFLETDTKEVGIGQQMEIFVWLDTEGETINALEGKVHAPAFLQAKLVRDGNSFISFWSERPQVDNDNTIVFSGVIPGGWQGTRGLLFSFVAETNAKGVGTIFLSDTQVLLHDGEGTAAATTLESLALSAHESIPLTVSPLREDDREPPEPFTPLLARDPDVFSGDHFLVFTAQDKDSGIDRYEVLETRKKLRDEREGNWKIEKSPYRLNDQSLQSFIYIRAIDRAGNIRVAFVEPVNAPVRIPVNLLVVLALLFVVIVFLIGVRIYTKRKTKVQSNIKT